MTNLSVTFMTCFFFLLFSIFDDLFGSLNNYNKEHFYNTKYTAVIVEPRQHKALSYVLKNFLSNLSIDWNIIIMHGNKNKEFVDNIIKNDLYMFKYRVTTINLNVDNLTINEYNNLLKSKNFYNNIPTETFLIFQTDSIICEENKYLINKFLKYDYVGAPLGNVNGEVGNGGLSLRKKSKMLEIIDNCPPTGKNEDVYFSFHSCVDVYRPTTEEAKKFSIENMYSDKSFGIHKSWVYLSKDDTNKIKKNCKSLEKLIELNK